MSDHDAHEHPPVAAQLAVHFDREAWPDGRRRGQVPLGLRLRFTAPPRPTEMDGGATTRPLGIALVIDRSSSMQGAPLEAAKQAALLLQQHLAAGDQRAVVAFDTEITLLAPLGGVHPQSAADRARLDAESSAIARLQPAGCTALTDGWQLGTRLLDEADLPADAEALTVVLSDGQGNRGIVDPPTMARLAAAAASFGVRTTCVGIGRHYSTPQLEALCEGGDGTLHQASEPEEIVECVLGELGRVRSTSVRDLELEIVVPGGAEALIVGGREVRAERFDRLANARTYRVRVGDVAGDASIDLGLLLRRRGAAARAEVLHFAPITVVARWRCAVSGHPQVLRLEGRDAIRLPAGVLADDWRDIAVAGSLLRQWHAWLVRRATMLNEQGDYAAATATIHDAMPSFRGFAEGLEGADELVRTLEVTGRRSRGRWEGRSKKELMVQSRKFSRGELDPRAAYDVADYGRYADRTD